MNIIHIISSSTNLSLLLRFAQIGVVSKGHECAHPDYPGIYTRVTAVRGGQSSPLLRANDAHGQIPAQPEPGSREKDRVFETLNFSEKA